MIRGFIKSYLAAAPVAGYLVARFAAPGLGNSIDAATDASDPLVGIVDRQGAVEAGMADIHLSGMAPVRLGGPVSAGDPLTAGPDGRAVLAEAGADIVRIVGYADMPGVENDIVDCWVAPAILPAT